jgi:hypothetical protein
LPSIASFTKDQVLLNAAKKNNVRTVGMPGSWDHFGRQYMPFKSDKLLVWGEQLKEEAIKYQFYKGDNIIVTGAPHFDQYVNNDNIKERKDFFNEIGFDSDTKLIFFGTGGSYYKDSYDIIDMLVKWIDEKAFGDKTALIVRPYPGAKHEEGKFDCFRNHPKVHFFEGNNWTSFAGFKAFINYLYYSDVIINVYSSISLEGAVMNRSVININFDGYQNRKAGETVKRFENLTHFSYLTKTKGVYNANSKEGLKNSIKEYFNNPKKDEVERRKLVENMCYKIDGEVSGRIVEEILNIH